MMMVMMVRHCDGICMYVTVRMVVCCYPDIGAWAIDYIIVPAALMCRIQDCGS